jgi:hypothetical protein
MFLNRRSVGGLRLDWADPYYSMGSDLCREFQRAISIASGLNVN